MKLTYKFILPSFCLAACIACSDDNYTSNDPNANLNAPTCYDVNDAYQSYSVFFKPKVGWVGDPMPFYEDGKFHVFYLQDARDGATTFHPWYEASTTDFTSYIDNGEMIPCGTDAEQDGALGTGSVFKYKNVYYGFYTGHNGKLNPREKILLATSTNLKNWTKDKSFSLEAADGYDRNEFRDPLIIRDETSNTFKMLISTRTDYNGSWRAVIAQYSSTDLRNWILEEPFYDDEKTFMIECPDVFVQGDYQYLVYSDIDDRMVHYKYRRIGSTQWVTPSTNGILDGIAFYAGKTASNGTDRYIFGWCPTKDNNSDNNNFGWGGSLVVHKLVQQTDGKLYVTIADGIDAKLTNIVALKSLEAKGLQKQDNTYHLNAKMERAYSVFDRQQGAYKIAANIKSNQSTSFGFEFGACGTRIETYAITFDITNQKLKLNRISKGGETITLTSTSLTLSANNEYNVKIVSENAVCVVYVNNEIAFTNRIYKMNQNPWTVFADDGEVVFSNLNLYK